MKFISKILFFVSLCVFCDTQSSARLTPKSVGNSVDESYVYKKGKIAPRSLSGRKNDAFSVLRLKKDNHTEKKVAKKHDVKHSEVFTLETVNGEPITNIDVDNATKLIFFYSGKEYDKSIAKMMAPAVIESLEDDKLREQCAKVFDLKVSNNEIDNEVARLAAMNNISVKELENKFESAGISVATFRKSIRSRIIFQMMAQSLAEDDKVSKNELDNVKREQQALINSERYLVIEIFRYQKESADKILQLAHKGFDFSALAENFSQAIKAGKRGSPRWIKASTIEPELLGHLKKIKPGEVSEVIKTKSGYKIIALIDTASPGKAASGDSSYKVLKASVTYHGKLFTQSDTKKAQETIEQLIAAENKEDFKKICKSTNVEYKETNLQKPGPYYRELINQSRKTGKPAAMQSPDDEGIVNVVLFLNEESAAAKLPNDEELKEIASEKKIEDMYTRSFKKIKSMILIEKNHKNIRRITQ